MKLVEITKNSVKNINGTSDKNCNCESWIRHWEKFSGNKAKKCAEVSCAYDAEVGAHVIKEGTSNKNHFIVPLCKGHNAVKDKYFEINNSLVSANVKETCGA